MPTNGIRCAPFRSVVRFFFQAEDGIRDIGVTGVQTCALPISKRLARPPNVVLHRLPPCTPELQPAEPLRPLVREEIGRASCRERVEVLVVAVSFKIEE